MKRKITELIVTWVIYLLPGIPIFLNEEKNYPLKHNLYSYYLLFFAFFLFSCWFYIAIKIGRWLTND